METINQNIRLLRKQKGMTQQQFADLIKVSRPALGAYEEGRAKPPLDVQKTLARLFDVSLDQLLTRDLSRSIQHLSPAAEKVDAEGKSLRVLAVTVDNAKRQNIELVPAKAAAGYLNGYADPEFVGDLPKFRLPMLTEGTYRAFEIAGDSMLPLQPGSIVVGEYVQDWTDLKEGQTYVVLSKQEGIVYKRVFNNNSKDGLILRSDNLSYTPYEINYEDVLELWKAKLFISTVPTEAGTPSLEKMVGMMMELQQEVIRLKEKQ
ncbi:MAG: helix-turn-helix domain-containing protein [Chitinophagales bacterium]|nr:helix-turn-helix domain-containing protein [Chitinophagales bacterium]